MREQEVQIGSLGKKVRHGGLLIFSRTRVGKVMRATFSIADGGWRTCPLRIAD
jgi:hypothetical protein